MNSISSAALSLILIVDDSATQLILLKQLLRGAGYLTTSATNGREAIERARKDKPILILSDILMPEMDGYEMCRVLKSDPALHLVPVMLLTSLTDTQDIISGLNARADYYLTKPYDPSYLLSRVASILEGHTSTSTPATEEDELEIRLDGQPYTVSASRRQMLSLMFSTYDHALQRNRELARAQAEMRALNEELQGQKHQLQEANARLQALATVDGLTGLKNFRAFQERLEDEFLRARRHNLALSLILLDVDKFKLFNDGFGHPSGDEVLRGVAQLIACTVRPTDFAARYGGEEFVVILPNTDCVGSLVIAERTRSAIETVPWPQRAITASLGVATLEGSDHNRASLLSRADAALYRSKSHGRNRVTHAIEMAAPPHPSEPSLQAQAVPQSSAT